MVVKRQQETFAPVTLGAHASVLHTDQVCYIRQCCP
jgi:hypothetical protein